MAETAAHPVCYTATAWRDGPWWVLRVDTIPGYTEGQWRAGAQAAAEDWVRAYTGTWRGPVTVAIDFLDHVPAWAAYEG